MKIATDSIVTLYGDTMAFMLLIGLSFSAFGFRHKKDEKGGILFALLCIASMINSFSNGVSYMLHHQDLYCPAALRTVMPGISEFSTLVVLFIWLVYVDYKLYDSWDRTRKVGNIFGIPVLLVLVLFLINIPTGIMFEVAEDFTFVSKPLFWAVTGVQYLYGILPIVAYVRYVVNHGWKHFFHISPLVFPVLVSSLFTLFTRYSARSFGFAIAIVFIYCSYINRWRFDDDETGFYNRNYLSHLKALARDRKADYKSAIIFAVDRIVPELKEILKTEVPKDGEIIRLEEDQLLLLTETTNVAMLEMLSEMIAEDAESYDKAHPDSAIGISSFSVLRKKNESAEDFIRRLKGEIA